MSAMPQKIRTGVVELRTHSGSVYVSPSFWERIYLLWAFRNFHSLPKQVLNRHQRQLIDKLCQTAILSRNGPIARTSIIGAVENVSLSTVRKAEAAGRASKLVTMSASQADVATQRAVGSEVISIRSNRAAYIPNAVGRFGRQSGDIQSISAGKQSSAEQSETKASTPTVRSNAGRRWIRNRWRWSFAATCGAALLGLLFYFPERRLIRSVTVPQVAIEAHNDSSGSIPLAAVVHPEKVQQSIPVERTQRSTTKPASAAVSSKQPESSQPEARLSQPRVETMDSTRSERLQVAEAPQSGFTYPVAPNPLLTGKVSLKAVIGTDGTVTEVEVLSGNRALAGAAVRAVRHWRYRSHELGGNAVEAETNIVISFVGDDAVSISFPATH